MTWNPLRKNHLTLKPSLAPNIIPKQEDRELENIFIQLQVLEENNKRLQKEIKIYMEGMVTLNKAEQKLTSDLTASQLCYHDDAMRALVEEYLTVTSQVGESVQEVAKICQKAVIDPLKRFGGEFSGIAASLQKREQLLQEVMRQESRQRKSEEKEKTAANILKRDQARKAVQQAKQEVQAIHSILLAELPQFYSQRSVYFTPCLQALIRAQVDYHGTTLRLFTELTNAAAKGPTPYMEEPETQFQTRIQGHLSAIQSLNIVAHPSNQAGKP